MCGTTKSGHQEARGRRQIVPMASEPGDEVIHVRERRQRAGLGKPCPALRLVEPPEYRTGRTGNARIVKNGRQGQRQGDRLNPFAFAPHECRCSEQRHRHVAAQSRRHAAGMARVNVPEAGEQSKGGSSVSRTASDTGRDRQCLFEVESRAAGNASLCAQRIGRLEHEIAGSCPSIGRVWSGHRQREYV